MKNSTLLAVGVLIGLLASALILLISAPSSNKAIELLPTATPSDLMIHISGAVQKPGIYSLQPGSRLNDAINLSGGFTSEADIAKTNLALHLQDGQKIHVPAEGETAILENQYSLGGIEGIDQPIDLNLADEDELMKLPGIGLTRAAEIIAYRKNNGPFDKIEDIQKVPGIGPVMFDNIKDWITVTH
jgi:competence protein ComEA